MSKNKSVQVHFVSRANGPERLVTEAELHFDDGPLGGMRLVGFSLWRSTEGELYVTFPSRAFGAGTERRYFDYLRAVDAAPETVKTVKAWILEEYRKQAQAAA
jgi:hypothetical protein